MKKMLVVFVTSFLCFGSFAQNDVPQYGFVTAGSTVGGISHSIGQIFNQYIPENESVSLVAEGIQQAYSLDVTDTLILLSDEMASYTPGPNVVYTSSFEGYDSIIHRQVYELTCPQTFDTTMAVSGQPWCHIELSGPYAAAVTPDEPAVTLSVSPGNPNDYPTGVASVATWTASVAGQTSVCHQNVIVRHYRCADLHSPVSDVDGNFYPVVNLGYLCWTGKNLRTTHYSDGLTEIPDVMTYPSSYAPTVSDMVATFGHLYTWNAAVNSTAQGICPSGWHIPTQQEAAYILSAFDASQLMSHDEQVHWIPSDGTDDFGFRFLPAGYYNSSYHRYEGLFVQAYFWTAETTGSEAALACQFGSACGTSELVPGRKDMGYSVRCIMNY